MAIPVIKSALDSAELYDLYVKSLDDIEKRFMAVAGAGVRVAIFVYDQDGGRMASTEHPQLAAIEVRNLLDGYEDAALRGAAS